MPVYLIHFNLIECLCCTWQLEAVRTERSELAAKVSELEVRLRVRIFFSYCLEPDGMECLVIV